MIPSRRSAERAFADPDQERTEEPAGISGRRQLAADPVIFPVSAVAILCLLAFSLVAVDTASKLFLSLQDWIVESFGWLLSASVTFYLLFAVYLGLSKHGRVRLGPDGQAASYSFVTWLAMLFSAGMGIGLLYYGVAEPVFHYASPPGGAPVSAASARTAMQITLFHWGLHAWGIYALLGLALAYFHHRRGRPLAIRWALEPLLGRYTDRLPGKLVDVVAVFGTLFGLATSLGLGSAQVNAGLARIFGVPESVPVQILLIGAITTCATVSLVSGLDRGIRRLSELNVLLGGVLMLFVLSAGPTIALLRGIPAHLIDYLVALPVLSVELNPFNDLEWEKSWTIFYWAWWISWAPFVGMFIARISRGRTVREFVLGVLVAPTAISAVWFGVFGGAALERDMAAAGTGPLSQAVSANVATAIFTLIEPLPLSGMVSILTVVVITLFFVTSSDSGSFVVDMLTSGGDPDPPVWQRIFWAVTEGAVAAVLLYAGGLKALQSAAINTGLPFCVVLLAVAVSLWLALRREPRLARAENPVSPPH